MASYRTIRIVPLILTLFVVAISIAALISVTRYFFFSNKNGTTVITQTNPVKDALLSTASDRSVRVTVRGRITSDENFRTYQIKITPSQRKMTTFQGYRDKEIKNITVSNNTAAYEQFVYALYYAGLIQGTQLTGASNDTRGLCATGFLYEFEIYKGDKRAVQLWTTNCKGVRGSLVANVYVLINLFNDQIPNYMTLTNGLWR